MYCLLDFRFCASMFHCFSILYQSKKGIFDYLKIWGNTTDLWRPAVGCLPLQNKDFICTKSQTLVEGDLP